MSAAKLATVRAVVRLRIGLGPAGDGRCGGTLLDGVGPVVAVVVVVLALLGG
jgi:hypothetical protein